MGRPSGFVEQKLRKGLWSPDEDEKLFNYITRFGVGCWSSVPKLAGLQRCGKSCRLRWINYLRPDLKRGMFSQQEENLIIRLHEVLGNRWAQIAAQLPGRTDNEIKNYWNSSLKKKLRQQGIDPITHKQLNQIEDQEEKNCGEVSLQPSQSNKLITISTSEELGQALGVNNSSYFHIGGLSEASKEHCLSKPIFDPVPSSFEFQSGFDGTGTNSNILLQHNQNLTSLDQIHLASNSGFKFTSMTTLSSCDYSNVTETEVSDNSTSIISTLFLNETKESCSKSSNLNVQAGFQMQNMVENAVSAWDAETKLESTIFQVHNGIKSEEETPSSWHEGHQQRYFSEDYISFPEDLTEASFDLFGQI